MDYVEDAGDFEKPGRGGRISREGKGQGAPGLKLRSVRIQLRRFAAFSRAVVAARVRGFGFSNPHTPREVAWYGPTPFGGVPRIRSNDVTVDDRGLIRARGLHILERV